RPPRTTQRPAARGSPDPAVLGGPLCRFAPEVGEAQAFVPVDDILVRRRPPPRGLVPPAAGDEAGGGDRGAKGEGSRPTEASGRHVARHLTRRLPDPTPKDGREPQLALTLDDQHVVEAGEARGRERPIEKLLVLGTAEPLAVRVELEPPPP